MAAYIVGLVSGFSLGWLASMRYQHNRRHRRLGGYVKPPASSPTRAVDVGASLTPRIQADFSSLLPPGEVSEVMDRLRALDPWSRRVAPISYGSGTGDRGGSGPTRPAPAGSVDPEGTEVPRHLFGDVFPAAPGSGLLARNRGDDAA